MKLFLPALFLLFLFACNDKQKNERPNILLIVADDLGYSDLGCFGSEISTPNIDRLAGEGIVFTNFNTAPMCAPSRAMLFTGNDNHIAGIGVQNIPDSDPRKGSYGYEGYFTDRVVTFPQLLMDAGYHTYMTGKWHLGKGEENSPSHNGFENSYILEGGAAAHYHNYGFQGLKTFYREDGKLVDYPEGTYSTDLYSEKLLQYMKSNLADGKPFFAMASYTSPHWPLQSPEGFAEKYEGVYDAGYEVLKTFRLEGLKEKGIIPEDSPLPMVPDTLMSWSELSSEQKMIESRKMELYAGMVDNLDFHVGNLIRFLKEEGLYDNTVIIFMSDNGAAEADFYSHPAMKDYIRGFYKNDYENMGNPNSFVSYGARWAISSVAAFKYFKRRTTEGGIRAPMIIKLPGTQESLISYDLVTIQDIAPTLLEFAGVEYPESYSENQLEPLKGISMLPYFRKEKSQIHSPEDVFVFEHKGYSLVKKGDWKVLNLDTKNNPHEFELYNTFIDPTESEDLREQEPEIYQDLLDVWNDYAEKIKLQYQ